MKLTVLGCGDAFGSGGRLQTSFHVALPSAEAVLIDCGATVLIGLQRAGLDPNRIGTILISHLHGDHFSGLIWLLMHARHGSKRTAPLLIAGPPGLQARVLQTAELLFPGATAKWTTFQIGFVELTPEIATQCGPLEVQAFEVSHPSGAPSYALRISGGDKTLSFSGDTEWVDALVACAAGADLFITECYAFDHPAPYHMNWRILNANLARLQAGRIMLSHMGQDMLANTDAAQRAGVLIAEDGLTLEL
jgi:ribonuclease BN (tRNA processing enzyme)